MGVMARGFGQNGVWARLLALGLLLGVAAGGAAEGQAPPPPAADLPPPPPQAALRVSVDGRAVVVTGPAGYCVDRAASRDGAEAAFVLLGSCAALGGGRARPAGPAGILTAAIQPGPSGAGLDAPALHDLARFLQSPAGRAALSRSGQGDDVAVAQALLQGDALLLQIEDQGQAGRDQGLQPGYWRAILPLRGRMVTLSALAPAQAPLSPEAGRALIEAFLARMRAANPAQP